MAFEPIETQEAFDAMIADRLKRERDNVTKTFEGWMSPADHEKAVEQMKKELDEATDKLAESQEAAKELTAKVRKYESDSAKTRIAHELGLPFEMADRLRGDDEAAMRKDGEALAAIMRSTQGGAPAATAEPIQAKDSKTAAYQSLLQSLNESL